MELCVPPLVPMTQSPAARRPEGEVAPRPRSAAKTLALILLAGVAVRALLWLPFRGESLHIWDEQDYHTLAVNLLRYGEFTLMPGETPTSIRPPLYPALVAGVYAVAGEGNIAAVRL